MFEEQAESLVKENESEELKRNNFASAVFILISCVLFVSGLFIGSYLTGSFDSANNPGFNLIISAKEIYNGLNSNELIASGNVIIDFFGITSAVFFLAMILGGVLIPLIFLAVGLMISNEFFSNNLIFLIIIPLALAAFSGFKSLSLIGKFEEKTVSKEYLRKNLMIGIISVLIAVVLGIALENIQTVRFL